MRIQKKDLHQNKIFKFVDLFFLHILMLKLNAIQKSENLYYLFYQ